MPQIKILIADDDDKILFAFKELFKKDGHIGIVAEDGQEALDKVFSSDPDLIFLDITMPKMNGLELLKEMKDRGCTAPVIIITGYGTMHTAIKAIQLGAFEYLVKPLDLLKVRQVITKATHSIKTEKIAEQPDYQFGADLSEKYEIIGHSQQMQEVFKLIGSISSMPNNIPVLIIGESGTGKELVARAIHNSSIFKNNPFIAINCSAFPETLLESELFGHEKGSFTGASDLKRGKFELADEGTIFLDEIGGLSLNLQQKLLRVIQQREFERVGGIETRKITARFIAATNTNIEEDVKKGIFREDLYFRLNVASINLPPLRERKEDIPILAQYFLDKYNFLLKKEIKGFSEKAINLLKSYSYPGNIRELENLIERSLILSKSNIIFAETFHDFLKTENRERTERNIEDTNFISARKSAIESFEYDFIKEKLKEFHGNVTKAAEDSKISRQNFQRLMKKYSLQSKIFKE